MSSSLKHPDPEKPEKFKQSKFDIFFLHRPFSGFYKGNRRQNEEIYTDWKKSTQTWFAGFRVFPGLFLHEELKYLSCCYQLS